MGGLLASSEQTSSQFHPSTTSHPTSSKHGYADVSRTAAWSDGVLRAIVAGEGQNGTGTGGDSSPETRMVHLPLLVPSASANGGMLAAGKNGEFARLQGKHQLAYSSESSADW